MAVAWHYALLGCAEYPLRKHREWRGFVVPYNTLEGRYDNTGSGGGARWRESCDEEAQHASGSIPAKRRLFSGGAASPEEAPKTCAATSPSGA